MSSFFLKNLEFGRLGRQTINACNKKNDLRMVNELIEIVNSLPPGHSHDRALEIIKNICNPKYLGEIKIKEPVDVVGGETTENEYSIIAFVCKKNMEEIAIAMLKKVINYTDTKIPKPKLLDIDYDSIKGEINEGGTALYYAINNEMSQEVVCLFREIMGVKTIYDEEEIRNLPYYNCPINNTILKKGMTVRLSDGNYYSFQGVDQMLKDNIEYSPINEKHKFFYYEFKSIRYDCRNEVSPVSEKQKINFDDNDSDIIRVGGRKTKKNKKSKKNKSIYNNKKSKKRYQKPNRRV